MGKKKWSRREALKAGVAGAAAIGLGALARDGAAGELVRASVADVRPAAEIADDGAGGTESERAGVNGAAARSSGATARAAAESSSPRGAITQFPAPVELGDAHWSCVVTTESAAWQSTPLYKPSFAFDELNLIVGVPDLDAAADSQQTMEGFGGCFNELGWTSLEALSDTDRESVMTELFDPKAGARFSYCRMPIGANDFAREPYSYDETDGDFAMDHFSIAHDQDTLVPFIQAALKHQPKLRLWASPWSPPTWMKNNHFYAEAKPYPGFKDNGIKPEQVGHEGEDMFIQEPRYFQAYALYFQKFIEAYRAAGIRVGMVMPQNEFNSAQNFPSCTWTADGLKHFIEYLGPAMQKIGVDVFFGTLERGNVKLLEAAMNDKKAAKYIKGVGVQWAGKNALADIAREFPGLTLFQSEQECGYNSDTWAYTTYCWQLMKEYFRRGARAYMYWNISTLNGGVSTWGWPQNSLVYVDAAEKNFKYSSDYYLLKHLTHYVDVGARRIETSGTCDDALAFLNPNDSVVLLVRNASAHKQTLQVQVADKTAVVELAPNSIGTLHLKSA